MNLSTPISSVIPSGHGPVLAVLARAGRPLTGRGVAALTGGSVGARRVNDILAELTEAGLVLRESQPPSYVYVLNRDHVAAPAIELLANQREELLTRIQRRATAWKRPALAVWLFGSAARGEGDALSDIDLLVVRGDEIAADEPAWLAQLDELSARITAWSGNGCEVLELTRAELDDLVERDDPLSQALRTDAVGITGMRPAALLRRAPRPVSA